MWSSCKYGYRSSLVVLHCTLHGIYLFSLNTYLGMHALPFVLMVLYFQDMEITYRYGIVEPADAPTVVLLVEHPLFPALARTVRGGCAYPFLTRSANPAGTSLTSNREFYF